MTHPLPPCSGPPPDTFWSVPKTKTSTTVKPGGLNIRSRPHFCLKSLVFVSIEKTNQTLETVFHRLSKRLELRQEYSSARRHFYLSYWCLDIPFKHSLPCVWYIMEIKAWTTGKHFVRQLLMRASQGFWKLIIGNKGENWNFQGIKGTYISPLLLPGRHSLTTCSSLFRHRQLILLFCPCYSLVLSDFEAFEGCSRPKVPTYRFF